MVVRLKTDAAAAVVVLDVVAVAVAYNKLV
jgi:hypothetical protein